MIARDCFSGQTEHSSGPGFGLISPLTKRLTSWKVDSAFGYSLNLEEKNFVLRPHWNPTWPLTSVLIVICFWSVSKDGGISPTLLRRSGQTSSTLSRTSFSVRDLVLHIFHNSSRIARRCERSPVSLKTFILFWCGKNIQVVNEQPTAGQTTSRRSRDLRVFKGGLEGNPRKPMHTRMPSINV